MLPPSRTAIGRTAATLLGGLVVLALAGSAGTAPAITSSNAAPSNAAPGGVVFAPAAGNFGANSGNWAGWVAAGHHTTVTAAWRQPAVTCAARETSDSAFWVGLDGYGSASVEQVGTQAGCSNGQPFYSAWTEFYPAPASTMSNPLQPGDVLRASVTFVSGHTYRLTLTDSTRNWSRTVTGTASRATNASVEVVAEAPTDANSRQVMRLTHFSDVRFSGVSVDGATLSRVSSRQQLVMGSRSRVMADTSDVDSSQSFSVTWRAATG